MSLPGILGKMAEIIGDDAAQRIGRRFAGMEVIFPSRKRLEQPRRDARIREDSARGLTVQQLAHKYNLSRQRIYQLLRDNSGR